MAACKLSESGPERGHKEEPTALDKLHVCMKYII